MAERGSTGGLGWPPADEATAKRKGVAAFPVSFSLFLIASLPSFPLRPSAAGLLPLELGAALGEPVADQYLVELDVPPLGVGVEPVQAFPLGVV